MQLEANTGLLLPELSEIMLVLFSLMPGEHMPMLRALHPAFLCAWGPLVYTVPAYMKWAIHRVVQSKQPISIALYLIQGSIPFLDHLFVY